MWKIPNPLRACTHSLTWFQYRSTCSSSVHSRTDTNTGRLANGRKAVTISPSLDSPSVAITSIAIWPSARNCGAIALIWAVMSRMWRHNGVPPPGWDSNARKSLAFPAPLSLRPTTIGGNSLRNRNSAGCLAASANSQWNLVISTNSAHRDPRSSLSIPMNHLHTNFNLSCVSHKFKWKLSHPTLHNALLNQTNKTRPNTSTYNLAVRGFTLPINRCTSSEHILPLLSKMKKCTGYLWQLRMNVFCKPTGHFLNVRNCFVPTSSITEWVSIVPGGGSIAVDDTDTWIVVPGGAFAGTWTASNFPSGRATWILWPGWAPGGMVTETFCWLVLYCTINHDYMATG